MLVIYIHWLMGQPATCEHMKRHSTRFLFNYQIQADLFIYPSTKPKYADIEQLSKCTRKRRKLDNFVCCYGIF